MIEKEFFYNSFRNQVRWEIYLIFSISVVRVIRTCNFFFFISYLILTIKDVKIFEKRKFHGYTDKNIYMQL